jgi:hypothetical protein
MTPPTHVVAVPGDPKALCGLKKPLPTIAAFAVPLHRANYELALCPQCEELLPSDPWKPAWLTEEAS